jgi:hypothetical protein
VPMLFEPLVQCHGARSGDARSCFGLCFQPLLKIVVSTVEMT